MGKSKLIVCSPELGIAPQSNSGGEVHDRETIKALCQQGIKVIVILPWKKTYLKHKNLIVYYFPLPFVWPPYLFNFFIIPYLFYLYKKHKFNILRIHSPYFVGLGALFFKLFYPRVPLIATYHHLEDKCLFNLIDKLFIRCWDKVICVSKFTKKEMLNKYRVNKNKIKIVYNGVSAKLKSEKKKIDLVKRYGLENKKVLLFFGGLKKRKNIGFLLKLVKLIEDSNVKLLICGQGGLKTLLTYQVRKLNLEDKVIFAGFIPEREKTAYYNLGDVFLFPSKKEGFGIPIIEAGACGLPSIASDISSLKELIINGKTGYLAEFNNVKDWKKKVKRLLRNKTLRQDMGRAAKKFSRKFSWVNGAKKQIEVYEKIETGK